MPPEFWTTVSNWGFPAALVAYCVWRFDQTILPVMLAHFNKLGEGFDTLQQAVANQTRQTEVMTTIANRIEEMSIGITADNEGIADDAKNARHHARRADDGIQELLLRVPQQDRQVG